MQNLMSKKWQEDPDTVLADDPSVIWATYDLNCSAALLCSGFELLSVDKNSDPRKALFIFKKDEGIEVTIDLYWSDRLDVKARAFADTIKALKNKLYSE